MCRYEDSFWETPSEGGGLGFEVEHFLEYYRYDHKNHSNTRKWDELLVKKKLERKILSERDFIMIFRNKNFQKSQFL